MYIDTKTRIISSIANPGADLTGVLYNEIIRAVNTNAIYLPTTCVNVGTGMAGVKALGFSGVSVSMPHKQEIMKHLDFIDNIANEIGAVNTVVKSGEKWGGFNTDWYGAVEALKEHTTIGGKRVVMFGAGGAARAIAYGITRNGGELYIHNRSQAKGEALAKEFGSQYVNSKELADGNEFDIVINATSIGFMGNNEDDNFIPRDLLHEGQVVLDIVFSPIETKLIQESLSRKAIVVPGYKMLIHQAILQFNLWLSVEMSDYSPVENALVRFIEERGL